MPAAAPPAPADTLSVAVVHSAATDALSVGDGGTVGVPVGPAASVSVAVGDGDNENDGEGDSTIGVGDELAGAPELPVQPLIATTELSAHTCTSRRTR